MLSRLMLDAKVGSGNTVYSEPIDFSTLDLLTKRFNSNKKYSDKAVKVFVDLNRLSKRPLFYKLGVLVRLDISLNDSINLLGISV